MTASTCKLCLQPIAMKEVKSKKYRSCLLDYNTTLAIVSFSTYFHRSFMIKVGSEGPLLPRPKHHFRKVSENVFILKYSKWKTTVRNDSRWSHHEQLKFISTSRNSQFINCAGSREARAGTTWLLVAGLSVRLLGYVSPQCKIYTIYTIYIHTIYRYIYVATCVSNMACVSNIMYGIFGDAKDNLERLKKINCGKKTIFSLLFEKIHRSIWFNYWRVHLEFFAFP
jgi:hypothetical protein